MEAPEKKAQEILRRELGPVYKGQTYKELEPCNFLSGFYLKSCHEEKIELKSSVLMELQTIETSIQLGKYSYEAMKRNGYTGFTSTYVSDALMLNLDLIPDVINQLVEADQKRGTSLEMILSRVTTCLKSIADGKFVGGLLEKCSDKFVGLWKVWLDNLLIFLFLFHSLQYMFAFLKKSRN